MNEELIELLSRSLDEPLSPADRARLDKALAESPEPGGQPTRAALALGDRGRRLGGRGAAGVDGGAGAGAEGCAPSGSSLRPGQV